MMWLYGKILMTVHKDIHHSHNLISITVGFLSVMVNLHDNFYFTIKIGHEIMLVNLLINKLLDYSVKYAMKKQYCSMWAYAV